MKIQHLIYSIILSSFASVAIAAPTIEYMECLAADQQHHFVLVAPAQNGQTIKLMYFPYLKPISLHYIKTENIEMAEDRPYEQHLFSTNIISNVIQGNMKLFCKVHAFMQ
ncbi:MAG: hypothetical protein ACRAUR_05980 [Acinetobacter tandoii]|uniref:hypothetical protein n=1 Tax=Acinetobacter tandoii TaxID=202954 RepID=UPI003D6BE9E8